MKLHPVILAGGSRHATLADVARVAIPKQFLPLLDGKSPFPGDARPPAQRSAASSRATVVANHEHRFLVADQAKRAGRALQHASTSSPWAAAPRRPSRSSRYDLVAEDPEALMLVLPADHDIPDEAQFADAVDDRRRPPRRQGHLMVFGVEPRWPETGYGYIERGPMTCRARPGCHQVASFVEKPELEIATRLARVRAPLLEQRHVPLRRRDVTSTSWSASSPSSPQPCRAAAAGVHATRPAAAASIAPAFERCRSMSIDHAVMERTQSRGRRARALPLVGHRLVGRAVGSRRAGRRRQRVPRRRRSCTTSPNCFVHSDDRLVVGIGLEDMVIIDTPDALLVARRGETQRVREAVEQLKAEGRSEHKTHRLVHRPWGTLRGHRPGRALPREAHHRRARAGSSRCSTTTIAPSTGSS